VDFLDRSDGLEKVDVLGKNIFPSEEKKMIQGACGLCSKDPDTCHYGNCPD